MTDCPQCGAYRWQPGIHCLRCGYFEPFTPQPTEPLGRYALDSTLEDW